MGWLLAYMLVGTVIAEGAYHHKGPRPFGRLEWIITAWTYPGFIVAFIIVQALKKRRAK